MTEFASDVGWLMNMLVLNFQTRVTPKNMILLETEVLLSLHTGCLGRVV